MGKSAAGGLGVQRWGFCLKGYFILEMVYWVKYGMGERERQLNGRGWCCWYKSSSIGEVGFVDGLDCLPNCW